MLERFAAALFVALGLLLNAASPARVADASEAPRRIVSLVPSVTEILFAIEAGPQVVAVSSYDTYPPAVQALPRVGGLVDPNTERILALRSDLVITYGSQQSLRDALARAGIATMEYRHGGLAQIGETIRALGHRTGHALTADRVAQSLESELADIRRRVAGRPKPRALLVFDRDRQSLKQMYASGGRGFLHELLELCGAVNVFADVSLEGLQLSSESVLTRAPDVILEIRTDDVPEGAALRSARAPWLRLAAVPAVARGRILFLNGRTVVPGPRIGEAAVAMARALHPDAFD